MMMMMDSSDHRAQPNSAWRMLAEELKTLRLPHKLKQYRQYCKRIEQLRSKIILDEQTEDQILPQEIDQLYTILDKSVICGVDQCFLCNSNAGSNDNSDVGRSSWLDSAVKPSMKQQMPALEEQNQFDGSIVNKNGINVEVEAEAEAEYNHCKNNGNLRNNNNNNVKSSLESNSDSNSSSPSTNTESRIDGDSPPESTPTNDQESDLADHQDDGLAREHGSKNGAKLSNGNVGNATQAPSASVEPLMMINNDSNGNNLQNTGGNKTSLCSPTIMSPRPYQKGSFLATTVNRSVPFIINNNNNNSYKAYKDFINNYAQAQTIPATNKN